MSAIVIIPVLIPAASALWPVVAAAAAAAAGTLGFSAVRKKPKAKADTEVDVPMENTEVGVEALGEQQELAFTKGDIQVTFHRNAEGKVGVRVCGSGRTEAELRAFGQQMADQLTQQYAYNRLVTELKARHFNVVNEDVEEDGTIRLQVRVFQG